MSFDEPDRERRGWRPGLVLIFAVALGACGGGEPAPGLPPPPPTIPAEPACGDGNVDPGERCDDGNAIDGDGCDRTCERSACSDGVVTSCRCGEVAPGLSDSIPLPGQITKLASDPSRCRLYALNAAASPELIVVDTANKKELRRVPLPEGATDLDMSPNGEHLVVSHASAVSIVDPDSMEIRLTLNTLHDAYAVEVGDDGVAYYARTYGFPGVRRFDLRTGEESDIFLSPDGDLELSSDGRSLYVGEHNSSGAKLVKYDVTRAPPAEVDRSAYKNGFPYPERHLYLSPGSHHVYYAAHQLDATGLRFVSGRTDERILAADRRGTYAVGTRHLFDAALVRPIAEVPHGAALATLTSSEQELWYYSADTVRLHFANPRELLGDEPLGVREVAPAPLADYQISELIHDPVRPRLYGLDTSRDAVVVVDAATLAPLRELRVGSTPTDLDLDPLGTTLFVGHLDVLGFARIDLTSLTFDRFVASPRNSLLLVALGADRVVTNDDDQFTIATLSDASSGAALDQRGSYQGTLAATADRRSVFVGSSGISSAEVTRYAVENDRFVQISRAHGFPAPTRTSLALPDGSGLYYAGALLDGADLSVTRYQVSERILAVTPDGELALSATGVYAAERGERIGDLGITATAAAISPDGTRAVVVVGRELRAVDLSAFRDARAPAH